MTPSRAILVAAVLAALAFLLPALGEAPATAPSSRPASRPVAGEVAPPDYLIVGVWQQPAASFPAWRERGVNTIFTDVPKPDRPAADRDAYFKAATEAGLRVVIGPDPVDPARDLARPAFLAWMQRDEPENWGALRRHPDGTFDTDGSIADYLAAFDRLKALSPSTPVFGNFNGMNLTGAPAKRRADVPVSQADYPAFMAGADWLGGDWYVRATGRPSDRIAMLQGLMAQRLVEHGGGKPFLVFVETCNQGLAGTPGPAAHPTPEEVRATAWLGLIHGARGIVYFPLKVGGGFRWDKTPPDVADALRELGAELRAAEPFVVRGVRAKGDLAGGEGDLATWTLPDGASLSARVDLVDGVWRTTVSRRQSPEVERLAAELEAARAEVERLRVEVEVRDLAISSQAAKLTAAREAMRRLADALAAEENPTPR